MEAFRESWPDLLDRFRSARILVVGDCMLDHFLWGDAERISPEAPVPVVRIQRESLRLGGAANVVNNLVSLGAKVRLVGVIGKDGAAQDFRDLVRGIGVRASDLVVSPDHPTTEKTRVIAHHQQMVRFDREGEPRLAGAVIEKATQRILASIGWADAIIISDYAKGLIGFKLMQPVLRAAKAAGLFVAVDPKPINFALYRGVGVVTPNKKETSDVLGKRPTSNAQWSAAGRTLAKKYRLGSLLITRGEQGMSLFEKEGITHIPTMAREVFDVTGAGDTVIATLALAVAVGAPLRQAAFIANAAAGIVVGEIGTAVVDRSKLTEQLQRMPEKFPGRKNR